MAPAIAKVRSTGNQRIMITERGSTFGYGNLVVDMRDPATGYQIEIYCEPVGVEDPIFYQLMHRGLFDAWFEAMREAAAEWDGKDPIRDARPMMMAALAAGAGAD